MNCHEVLIENEQKPASVSSSVRRVLLDVGSARLVDEDGDLVFYLRKTDLFGNHYYVWNSAFIGESPEHIFITKILEAK